jgi:hypothetical protein
MKLGFAAVPTSLRTHRDSGGWNDLDAWLSIEISRSGIDGGQGIHGEVLLRRENGSNFQLMEVVMWLRENLSRVLRGNGKG